MKISNRDKGYLFLFIALFLWGIHGPAGRFLAIRGIDMLWVSAARVLIGCAVFGLYCLAKKIRVDFRENFLKMATLSFVGLFLNTITYHLALNHISGTLLMILENLAPLFVFLMGFLLSGVTPTKRESVALLLSFSGILLITAGKGSFSFGTGNPLAGIFWGVLAGFTFGWYTYFSAEIMRPLSKEPDKVIAFLFKLFFVSALLMFPLLFRDCKKPGQPEEWFWLIEMGLFQSAGAYIFWNQALRFIPANKASVLFLFTILFTAINETLFLSLVPNWVIIAGGIMIITAGRMITREKKG